MVKSAKKPRALMAKIHFSPAVVYVVPHWRLQMMRDHIVRVGKKIVPERGKRDLVRRLIVIGERQEARAQ